MLFAYVVLHMLRLRVGNWDHVRHDFNERFLNACIHLILHGTYQFRQCYSLWYIQTIAQSILVWIFIRLEYFGFVQTSKRESVRIKCCSLPFFGVIYSISSLLECRIVNKYELLVYFLHVGLMSFRLVPTRRGFILDSCLLFNTDDGPRDAHQS